jgi:hypothetical protein
VACRLRVGVEAVTRRCDWCGEERVCESAKAGRGVLWICEDCAARVILLPHEAAMIRLFASLFRAWIAHTLGPESAYPHLASAAAAACIARDGVR